jgi:hypothetical protein
VRDGVRAREAAFLQAAERLIYGSPSNPLRALLAWAGCELGDLGRMITGDGVEGALSSLRTAGVFVTEDEFRGRIPIRRGSLEIAVEPAAFDNPERPAGIDGAATGTLTAGRLPLHFTWTFLEAEASAERLLLASHGLDAARMAFWLPGPPEIAGMHHAIVHAKMGRAPDRWFAGGSPPGRGDGEAFHVLRGWRIARRVLPELGPDIEWLPPGHAEVVARWLAESPRPVAIRCVASAAADIADVATDGGLDVSGIVVLAEGAPLPPATRERLKRAGMGIFARHATPETGFIAGACAASASDEMHLYADRLAVIGGSDAEEAAPLAFTSLSLEAPKVLLNVELGDRGTLRRKSCGCAMGRAGLAWHVKLVGDLAAADADRMDAATGAS